MTNFDVTILGSNSAISDHGRHPTSQVIQIYNQLFLMDCGEGTQLRLLQEKIKWFSINHIFISHLHGDHYFGLIGLLICFIVFTAVSIWAWKADKKLMNKMGNIPLEN